MYSDTGSIFKELLLLNEKIFNQENNEVVTAQVYKLVNDISRKQIQSQNYIPEKLRFRTPLKQLRFLHATAEKF